VAHLHHTDPNYKVGYHDSDPFTRFGIEPAPFTLNSTTSQYGSYDNTADFQHMFGDITNKASNDDNWELPYKPRQQLVSFHQREQRYAFLICHRRFGKTVGCIAELAIRALYTTKKNSQYAYVCPFRTQAKAVAWNYLVEMTQGIAVDVKVSELSVTLPNGAKIWLSGSDNVNALRGLYLDGVVIDEFAQCRPDLLEAVLMPCLVDRKGWLVIIGTAYGRLNQFYDYYEKSKTDDSWYHADIKVYDSGVIDPEEIENIKSASSDAKFRQEFLNDFSAELVGTYYASIINEIEQLGQINQTTHWDRHLQVHVAFDIGRGDNTVAWFWQEHAHGINIIDFYTNNGEQAQHYISMLQEKPYDYKTINLPHDAKAETFATHKSAMEQFLDATFGPDTQVRLVPKLSVEDGIEATRQILKHANFDYDRCYYGVECLRVYRKKWDAMKQCFMKTPLHDYSSDAADAFRYLAIQANKQFLPAPTAHESIRNSLLKGNDVSLGQMFEQREKSKNSNSYRSKRV
jgi:phage terminase large subunit